MEPDVGTPREPEASGSTTENATPVVFTVLVAGLFGQLAFEIYAWIISPAIFAVTLEPAALLMGLLRNLFGIEMSYTQAFLIHFFVGISFSLLVAGMAYVTRLGFVVSGVITGVILWFIAQGILAPLVGFRFLIDFNINAQSALIAQVGMATIMGLLLDRFLRKD